MKNINLYMDGNKIIKSFKNKKMKVVYLDVISFTVISYGIFGGHMPHKWKKNRRWVFFRVNDECFLELIVGTQYGFRKLNREYFKDEFLSCVYGFTLIPNKPFYILIKCRSDYYYTCEAFEKVAIFKAIAPETSRSLQLVPFNEQEINKLYSYLKKYYGSYRVTFYSEITKKEVTEIVREYTKKYKGRSFSNDIKCFVCGQSRKQEALHKYLGILQWIQEKFNNEEFETDDDKESMIIYLQETINRLERLEEEKYHEKWICEKCSEAYEIYQE